MIVKHRPEAVIYQPRHCCNFLHCNFTHINCKNLQALLKYNFILDFFDSKYFYNEGTYIRKKKKLSTTTVHKWYFKNNDSDSSMLCVGIEFLKQSWSFIRYNHYYTKTVIIYCIRKQFINSYYKYNECFFDNTYRSNFFFIKQ